MVGAVTLIVSAATVTATASAEHISVSAEAGAVPAPRWDFNIVNQYIRTGGANQRWHVPTV